MENDFLEGDPNAESVCFVDLSGFVSQTEQECRLIAELIQAQRYEEAQEVAQSRQFRAKSLLKDLEKPSLPQVDTDATADCSPAGIAGWRYKRAGGRG